MMKKLSSLKIIVAAFILLSLVGFISFYPENTRDSSAISNSTRKTYRLFRQMGVLRHPDSVAPVEITLKDLKGKLVRLSSFKGSIVFLNFWASWCPDCVIEMSAMEKLHTRLKNKNFFMIAINIKEPASRVREFYSKNKLTFTGLLDPSGQASYQMNVRAIPMTFILDKSGKIIASVLGSRQWDSKKSIALFEHLTDNASDIFGNHLPDMS